MADVDVCSSACNALIKLPAFIMVSHILSSLLRFSLAYLFLFSPKQVQDFFFRIAWLVCLFSDKSRFPVLLIDFRFIFLGLLLFTLLEQGGGGVTIPRGVQETCGGGPERHSGQYW